MVDVDGAHRPAARSIAGTSTRARPEKWSRVMPKLAHRLDDQHARIDRLAREMAGEAEVVAGKPPVSADAAGGEIDRVDAIHQQHRRAVRQQPMQRVGVGRDGRAGVNGQQRRALRRTHQPLQAAGSTTKRLHRGARSDRRGSERRRAHRHARAAATFQARPSMLCSTPPGPTSTKVASGCRVESRSTDACHRTGSLTCARQVRDEVVGRGARALACAVTFGR